MVTCRNHGSHLYKSGMLVLVWLASMLVDWLVKLWLASMLVSSLALWFSHTRGIDEACHSRECKYTPEHTHIPSHLQPQGTPRMVTCRNHGSHLYKSGMLVLVWLASMSVDWLVQLWLASMSVNWLVKLWL